MINSLNEENILIIGDLNGRIGDFNTGKFIDNPNLTQDRFTKDNILNKNGEKIIELINDLDMEIINGRTASDKRGEITFTNKNGKSVIDLCLAAGRMENELMDLKVGTCFWSDHQPLEITFECGMQLLVRQKQHLTRIVLPSYAKRSYKIRVSHNLRKTSHTHTSIALMIA